MTEAMTIEQEIVHLQQQLEAKKAELGTDAQAPEAVPHDKEILHEVVGEKIQQHSALQQAADPAAAVPAPVVSNPAASSPTYLDPELQSQVQNLVNIAFTTNINAAIQAAVKTDNAALIDAFHDVLVDQLYDQLLERKKIEQL